MQASLKHNVLHFKSYYISITEENNLGPGTVFHMYIVFTVTSMIERSIRRCEIWCVTSNCHSSDKALLNAYKVRANNGP